MLFNIREKDIKLASSKANFPAELAHLKDPLDIEKRCFAILKEIGFETSIKEGDSNTSTTAFGKVWWASNWRKKSPQQRAKVAVHETTHAIQEVKRFLFEITFYPRPRKLWICEVQAYGAGLRAMKQMGFSEFEIRVEAERNAESIKNSYPPTRLIRKKSLNAHTVATLLSHVGMRP